jgi:hypothetical protein
MSGYTNPGVAVARTAAAGILIAGLLLGSGGGAEGTDADNPFRGRAPDCFVYHSAHADGLYDFTRVLPLGSHTLGLWATAGATTTAEPSCAPGPSFPGPPFPGTGEICFVSFVIEKSGGGSLDSFTFSGGLSGGTRVSPDGSTLTVNLSVATSPLPGGFASSSLPLRIGDIGLTMGTDTVVNLTRGSCLGLGAENRAVPVHTMFLPEPGEYALLATGLFGLAGLYRLKLRLARSH